MALSGLNQVLIAIGSQRQQRGYGGNAAAELERLGLVCIDAEWSGCITLTDKGWDRYQQLTETRAEREHPEWFASMSSSASSMGYETARGDNGETLYMVGDEWVSEQEAREYAQHEADALAAMGDPEAYEGYPPAIAPQRPQGPDGE